MRDCRLQLSFVTTTVFGTGAAPTITMTELASTVTQQVTMTMVQMIACGTTQGAPVPAAEASIIASSAAAAASSAFTSGAAQLASTAIVASGQAAAPAPASTALVASSQVAAPILATTPRKIVIMSPTVSSILIKVL